MDAAYKNDEKILLILDLDQTLVHASKEVLAYDPVFTLFDYHVYLRPFLNEFLGTIHGEFLLAIWSSASDDYVQEIVRRIIPGETKLEFVWGRSKCTFRRKLQVDEYGFYDADVLTDYHFIKPLKKVKKLGYHLNRILIVDDSPHKVKENYGNAIYSKPFTGDIHDNELNKLAPYLLSLKEEKNVRTIEKRNWREQLP